MQRYPNMINVHVGRECVHVCVVVVGGGVGVCACVCGREGGLYTSSRGDLHNQVTFMPRAIHVQVHFMML